MARKKFTPVTVPQELLDKVGTPISIDGKRYIITNITYKNKKTWEVCGIDYRKVSPEDVTKWKKATLDAASLDLNNHFVFLEGEFIGNFTSK